MGFTLSVYKQVLLDNYTSIVLDRGSGLTVQPNLRIANVNSTSIACRGEVPSPDGLGAPTPTKEYIARQFNELMYQ